MNTLHYPSLTILQKGLELVEIPMTNGWLSLSGFFLTNFNRTLKNVLQYKVQKVKSLCSFEIFSLGTLQAYAFVKVKLVEKYNLTLFVIKHRSLISQ